MKRLLLAVVAGCCLAGQPSAVADPAPFTMPKQYSTEMVVTSPQGSSNMKSFADNEKIRNEVNAQGMSVVSIIRPDEKKMYSVMPAQKMVMEMPLDPAKQKMLSPSASVAESKFELIGPDAVDSVTCTKYKVTGSDKKVCFMWVDTAKQVPVKLTAEDGSFTVVWKNFVTGPQAADLFEPPKDYQVMKMPGQ